MLVSASSWRSNISIRSMMFVIILFDSCLIKEHKREYICVVAYLASNRQLKILF